MGIGWQWEFDRETHKGDYRLHLPATAQTSDTSEAFLGRVL